MAYKLMIVDDEPANLRLLERLFRNDFNVLTAESGAEALSLLEQHDVALIITDQRMPGMSGIELLKRTTAIRPHMVRIGDLRLTVKRALAHHETNKARHELEMRNHRLITRLQKIQELSIVD